MTHNQQALESYQRALFHNKNSIEALRAVASILRTEDKYEAAVDYIRTILQLNPADGESWSSLGMFSIIQHPRTYVMADTNRIGHCYLMMDELQQAYTAYQSALYNLRDPKVILKQNWNDFANTNKRCRSQSCGMALEYYMTDTDLLTMQKKHSAKLCAWRQSLTKPTRFTFAWA